MHRRYANRNIPIETLRAFVAINDSGSFTSAAETLGLTQPAISAQMRRLRTILGGDLFEHGPGMRLTRRGALVLGHAKRILAVNDQLFHLAGPTPLPHQMSIGLPRWFNYRKLIEIFGKCSDAAIGDRVIFRCDEVEGLSKELSAGSLDVAFLCNISEPPTPAVVEWQEPLHWVKSPKLMLKRGSPIPLVSWAGSLPDRIATKLLQDANMQYSVAFSGPDHASRKAAVAAGLGVMLFLERSMTSDMEVAHEPYLPKPPTIRTGLFVSAGLDRRRVKPILEVLEDALRPRQVVPTAAARKVQRTPRRRVA